jgi:hypothetical protein
MDHKIIHIFYVENIQNHFSTDISQFSLQFLSKNLAQYLLITFCKVSFEYDQFI